MRSRVSTSQTQSRRPLPVQAPCADDSAIGRHRRLHHIRRTPSAPPGVVLGMGFDKRLKGTLFRSFQIRSRAVSTVAAVPHLAWQREFILLKAIAMAILHRRWRIHWEPHGVPTRAVASPPHWMMPLIVRLRPLGTTRIRAMKSWLSAPEMSRARRQRTKIEGRHGKIFIHGLRLPMISSKELSVSWMWDNSQKLRSKINVGN